jgi:hypothetical protein
MGGHVKQHNTPPAGNDADGTVDRPRPTDSDRRVVRTVDLTDEDIAAIEASEMASDFDRLEAEVDDVE